MMKIYLGENLSTKYPLIFYLRLYFLPIFFSSMNVFYQSFVHSILSNQQLNHYENFLLVYSLIYSIFALLFLRLFGISGIILINSLNIFGRILLNNYFLNRYLIVIQWMKWNLFSCHYVFLLLSSLMMFYFNQILIDSSFGQLIFAIGWILTIICLTLLEEKELFHYLSCVYKLNSQNQRSIRH